MAAPNPIETSSLDALVDEILVKCTSRKADRSRIDQSEVWRIARHDYSSSVREHLSESFVRHLIRAARRLWPAINKRPVRHSAPEVFKREVARLGVDLCARPYGGPRGLALRGFYIDSEATGLRRPLIYLNTAHEPAAVSATYCHEVGHFLTTKITKSYDSKVNFFFSSAYSSHLNDRSELAADAMASLAAYPYPLARRIFSKPGWELSAKPDKLIDAALEKAFAHVRGLTGFEFKTSLPAGQNLNYLAGLIHYAKLRSALLAAYNL
ncbi:MAG TPA: hypothetical protein VMA09_00080 [Candidatus Binataceae bacterium]|nr:hypothetical protein [Candidatus Binataceae bacterium]